MAKSRKTLLSGIQPSGRPHIGNYFGAMKQFVDMSATADYDCFFMIADCHALNTIQDAKLLKQSIIDLAADYLAIGLDPKKSVIFKQSDVSEHTELAWIFETLTTMPYLQRAHAYKDAGTKNKEISVGLFNYPMLMAADILLYDTDVVPVGQDQKQHVEITRDTAEKFNRIYPSTSSGQAVPTFKLPEAKILQSVAVVPGIDGRKMSKSYGNTIPLFAEDAEIEKLVMGIVTHSGGTHTIDKQAVVNYVPLATNVFKIHSLFKNPTELIPMYNEKTRSKNYKFLKEALIEDIKTFIRPLREKRKAIADDTSAVLKVLKGGGRRAKEKASAKMDAVREKVGVKLY